MSSSTAPIWIPDDLAGWFPEGMLLAAASAPHMAYAIGIAACSQCGAGVPVYRPDDYTHLRRHIEWHRRESVTL